MYPSGRYNLNFNISAVFMTFFLLIIYFGKKDRNGMQGRIFMVIIFFLNISGILDLITTVMRNDPSLYNYKLEEAVTFLTHIIHNSLSCVYSLYIIYITRCNFLMNKRHKISFFAPEAVLILFSLVPSLRNMLYYYDNDGNYVRGILYGLYYVITCIYFLFSAVVIIRFRKVLKGDMGFLLVFFIGSVFSLFLAAAFPYLRATIFMQSVCALGSFILIENENTLIDGETGAFNRYALLKEADVIYSGPFNSVLISVKIPNIDYYLSVFGLKNVIELLRGISAWLSHLGGRKAAVYYPSKGSFVMILYSSTWEEGMNMAEEIEQRFDNKWDVTGINTYIPAQVWISDAPGRIKDMDQMLYFANAAFNPMIRGEIRVVDRMGAENRQRNVEEAVRRGIRGKRLKVVYQPILDVASGTFKSAEALIRYTDEELGTIPPEEFIAAAERIGAVGKVGEIVFHEVCRFCSEVHPEQYGIDFISVNLSAVQCMDDNLPQRLSTIAGKYGTNTRRINLEINESVFSYNGVMMEKAVRNLRRNGFFISLDGFVTGEVSFNDLIKYPFSIIKIDRNTLWDSAKDEKKDRIMKHIIEMVRDLGFKVVVEGVENEEQKEKLLKLKVEYIQGFLYSRPVSGRELIEVMKSQG